MTFLLFCITPKGDIQPCSGFPMDVKGKGSQCLEPLMSCKWERKVSSNCLQQNPLRWHQPWLLNGLWKEEWWCYFLHLRREASAGSSCQAAIGHWADVSVISSRDTGQRSGLKIATATGDIPFAGSCSSGTFPNSIQASIPEPRPLAVTGPGLISEASSVKRCLIALSPLRHPRATTMPGGCTVRSSPHAWRRLLWASSGRSAWSLLRWWAGCCRKGLDSGGSSGWTDCSSAQMYCYLTWSCRWVCRCPLGQSSSSYWGLPRSAQHRGHDCSTHCLGHWTGRNDHWVVLSCSSTGNGNKTGRK